MQVCVRASVCVCVCVDVSSVPDGSAMWRFTDAARDVDLRNFTDSLISKVYRFSTNSLRWTYQFSKGQPISCYVSYLRRKAYENDDKSNKKRAR